MKFRRQMPASILSSGTRSFDDIPSSDDFFFPVITEQNTSKKRGLKGRGMLGSLVLEEDTR